MANFKLNVNTDAAIILTAKLERMHRSAMPSAIRSTLNDAAFTMKKKEILSSARLNMTVRNPIFFKKFTGVKRATGFKVDTMYSEVGFKNTDKNPIKGKKAIEGMESNEFGGQDNDGGMYIGKSRNAKGLVKRNARFDKSKVTRGYKSSNIRTKKSNNNFMGRVFASIEDDKNVFINSKSGRFLVKAISVERGTKDKKAKVKLEFLMRHRKQHIAKAKATHFNREAAITTSKQMDGFYLKNAEFQFNKVLKSTR